MCLSCGATHCASSYIRIIVFFLLPMPIFICMDYREQLADSPISLILRSGTGSDAHTHLHTQFVRLLL